MVMPCHFDFAAYMKATFLVACWRC